jgi:hypothetical protein
LSNKVIPAKNCLPDTFFPRFFYQPLNFCWPLISKAYNKLNETMETTNLINAMVTGLKPVVAMRSKLMLLVISLMVTVLISCNKDEDATPGFSTEDKESAGFDSKDDFFYDDADDLVNAALVSDEAGGKQSTDDRLACAIITFTGTKEAGSLTIDFGAGCTGPFGNTRSGKIHVERVGTWDVVGSYWTITFENYFINATGLEGTRTVKVVEATEFKIAHEITLVGGRITWPNGAVGTREVERRREFERNQNHILDRLIIYGTAQGTLCNGRGYKIEITEPLIYDRTCAAEGVIIPVQGIKVITHGLRVLTVDYGDGTCDNVVTLTNQFGRTVRYEVVK